MRAGASKAPGRHQQAGGGGVSVRDTLTPCPYLFAQSQRQPGGRKEATEAAGGGTARGSQGGWYGGQKPFVQVQEPGLRAMYQGRLMGGLPVWAAEASAAAVIKDKLKLLKSRTGRSTTSTLLLTCQSVDTGLRAREEPRG